MRIAPFALAAAPLLVLACSSTDGGPPAGLEPEPCAKAGVTSKTRLPAGSPDGHADPFGAKAAKQARAGRVRDASMIAQAADARQKVRVGDYVLANEKIAAYIEGARPSDGYSPFGGEIASLDAVGDDGRPRGLSLYGETLLAFSRQAVAPESVTVLADGADGKAAVVRATGVLKNIPFLDTFRALFPEEYDFPVALDYVLEPGAEKLVLRLTLVNTKDEAQEFPHRENIGFFQSSRSQTFTESKGFAMPKGLSAWVAFDAGRYGFAWRQLSSKLDFGLYVSGFQHFQATGLALDACATKTLDYAEVIGGGPDVDGVLAAIRRADRDESWRPVRGKVVDGAGQPVAGAFVHATAADGRYLTRATTDAQGAFQLHVPRAGGATVVPSLPGWATPAPTPVGDADVLLTFGATGSIVVRAREAGSLRPIPARVQVVPASSPGGYPEAWGLEAERNGRLHQEFAVTGDATLPVPPGQHRVIVTRGYEWELLDTTVTVAAGQSTPVDATLAHSVDSAGVMCADFHIHSYFSADSNDNVVNKVKSAIADGLDIPVSSEHEWVIDFQPVIQQLGLGDWAFGMASEELTTFTWGHFGVVPITPRPEKRNNGAVDWVGLKPAEVFKTVRELPESPALIVNHPEAGSVGGYFSAAGFKRETGTGNELWSDDFTALEVFNDSDFESVRKGIAASWFSLLDAGKTYWAVGSSDSHHIRSSPVGYPRTCLRVGHDDPRRLTPEVVRDAVKRGAAVVSGGLTMTVEAPGGAGPGETATAGQYKVTVRAPSWLEASKLEVIVDGVSTQTIDLTAASGGPERRYDAQVNVSAASSRPRHWVVFHAKGPDGKDLSPLHPGRRPFAVSNPIFF
jgi:hypothetical protein